MASAEPNPDAVHRHGTATMVAAEFEVDMKLSWPPRPFLSTTSPFPVLPLGPVADGMLHRTVEMPVSDLGMLCERALPFRHVVLQAGRGRASAQWVYFG